MLYLIPPVLSLLSIAILWLALPHANEFRRPSRYRRGVVLTALGCTVLWVAPLCLYLTISDWHLRNLLVLVILVIPFGMIGGGLYKISKANNSPSDDMWDNIFGA
jgi:hypothetical protein